jgi:glucose/mannose-6-phosphate isomerase
LSTNLTPEQMEKYLFDLPEQFRTSLSMDLTHISRYTREYRQVVISGLGGSAIGGDILRSFAMPRVDIPVIVNRDYDVPKFVNENTLFLAISYSGNTEETLSSFHKARDRGASIICITSGGKLESLAAQNGCGVVKIPVGLVPRAATGHLFAPLALVLEQLGLLSGARLELEETALALEKLRESLIPAIEPPKNQAREIARLIKGKIPVIWGSAGVSETAAMRWKGQINENAKSLAYFNVFPELNHNEIVGFEWPPELIAQMAVIILRDKFASERINRRIEITKKIIQDKVGRIIEVQSEGVGFLARFFSLTYVGDYASYYLALEYGVNPTPVKVIDFLKTELAK